MPRGPRTPQGIARVTATIELVNALGLNRRREHGKREPARAAALGRPEVRALSARIMAILEDDGQGVIPPTYRVVIELLATALAMVRTRLAKNGRVAR